MIYLKFNRLEIMPFLWFSVNMSFLRLLPICRSYGTFNLFMVICYRYYVPNGTQGKNNLWVMTSPVGRVVAQASLLAKKNEANAG